MPVSDEQLMQRAAAGDVGAFGELFDRYQPRLLAFLTRFLGDVSLAEDAAQEAFWRAWEYRGTYDVTKRFSSWLYVIAKNTAVTEAKKPHRRTVSLSSLEEDGHSAVDQLPAAASGEPHTALSTRILRDEVRAALQALPRDQRLCLVLREYEHLSHREAAEVMGCSEGAVRVLAFRARRALARLLKSSLESEDCLVG